MKTGHVCFTRAAALRHSHRAAPPVAARREARGLPLPCILAARVRLLLALVSAVSGRTPGRRRLDLTDARFSTVAIIARLVETSCTPSIRDRIPVYRRAIALCRWSVAMWAAVCHQGRDTRRVPALGLLRFSWAGSDAP